MFRLNGKIALVTGGSRGIGRATALALAHQGAVVVVNYASNETAARAVVDEIQAAGGVAESLRFDVSDSARVDEAITDVVKRHGKLDILVANAGIAIDGLLLRLKDEDLDRLLAVNLRGALACARSAMKSMVRARQGRIVFVSSVIGEIGNAGQAAYASSKAALLGLSKTLAREYGSRGITVNAVAPGLIDTDMTSRLDDATRKAVASTIPLGHFGKPEDVAAAVVFLASDEAAYVTGHTLRINGGMYV
jgi:3-oxoacyl-[acyl-carrier protein] reductase